MVRTEAGDLISAIVPFFHFQNLQRHDQSVDLFIFTNSPLALLRTYLSTYSLACLSDFIPSFLTFFLHPARVCARVCVCVCVIYSQGQHAQHR